MIPGVKVFHPRESWQDPAQPVVGPLDDPSDNDTVVVHYTAADDLIDGDPGEHADDLPQFLRNIQDFYVTRRGYSVGYLFAVDWLGGVWQMRGWEYQSAANRGHNGHTFPVLMLVDGDDSATAEAAVSVRAIGAEAQLRAGRSLTVVGHKDIGDTSCPGVGLYAQVKAGVFSPGLPPPVVVPPVDEEDEEIMIAYVGKPPAGMAGNPPWLLCVNGAVRYATNVDTQHAVDNGWAFVELNAEQYPLLLKGAGLA